MIYYEESGGKLYLGNCKEILKNFSDDYIDLVVTSPPYDELRDYKGYKFDFEGIADQLWRIIKPGGVVVWVVQDATIKGSETGTSLRQALYFMDIGFRKHDTMIYEKSGCPYPERVRYYQNWEYMFIFSKGKPKTINLIADRKNKWAGTQNWGKNTARQKDGTLLEHKEKRKIIKPYGVRFNIWRYKIGGGMSTKDKVAYNHPAIFPEKLAEDHIISWSEPGDIVLDPLCGSGTTCKMAKLQNRYFIGIDVSEEYLDISKERLQGVR